MARKYNRNNYGKFKKANKFVRDSSLAPDPLSKLDNHGIGGKIAKKATEKIISSPLDEAAYKTTGAFYDRKNDSPYKGSALFTSFKWGDLLLMMLCPLTILVFILWGLFKLIRSIFN